MSEIIGYLFAIVFLSLMIAAEVLAIGVIVSITRDLWRKD